MASQLNLKCEFSTLIVFEHVSLDHCGNRVILAAAEDDCGQYRLHAIQTARIKSNIKMFL